MSKQRVVLVTGGMGGLGEAISTKLADAGYRVVVTYSPGNTKHADWLAEMKKNGYDIYAVACDVADYDSCTKAVADAQDKVGNGLQLRDMGRGTVAVLDSGNASYERISWSASGLGLISPR